MVWTHSERRSVPTHHDVGSLKIRGNGTSIHGQFNGDSHLAPTSTRAPRRALRARCSLPAVACPLFFRPLGALRLALCALRLLPAANCPLPAVLISPSRTTVSLDRNMLKLATSPLSTSPLSILATSPLSITSQPMKVAGAAVSVTEVRVVWFSVQSVPQAMPVGRSENPVAARRDDAICVRGISLDGE